MDFSLNGQPAVFVGAKTSIDTGTMDFSLNAHPFVGQPATTMSHNFFTIMIGI